MTIENARVNRLTASFIWRRVQQPAVAVILVLVAVLGTRPAEADGELTLTVHAVDDSQYPKITLDVTAATQGGRRLPDLGQANFLVTSGGQRIPVEAVNTVSEEQATVAALLAIDVSGSMYGEPIAAAREAAIAFTEALQDGDQIAAFAFSDAVQPLTGFTTDRAAARNALSTIQARGDTALYDAVAEAVRTAVETTGEQRVAVLLSDGADYGVSSVSRQESLRIAGEAGLAFYIIALGDSTDMGYLEDLRDATAGELIEAPSPEQLTAIFSDIAVKVRSSYTLTLDASEFEGPVPAVLRVQVGDLSGETQFDFAAPVAAVSIPREVAPVSEPPVPEPPASSGFPVWLLALLVVPLAAGYLVFRRLQRRRKLRPFPTGAPPLPVFSRRVADTEAAPASEHKVRLIAEDGREFTIGGSVVTIGTGESDTFRLTEGPQSWAGSLRIWLANGRFIVHDTSVRPVLRLNGKGTTWAFLSDGDQIQLGNQVLKVDMQAG